MKFILFDNEILLGSYPDKEAALRVKKGHQQDYNRDVQIYINIEGQLKPWREGE